MTVFLLAEERTGHSFLLVPLLSPLREALLLAPLLLAPLLLVPLPTPLLLVPLLTPLLLLLGAAPE